MSNTVMWDGIFFFTAVVAFIVFLGYNLGKTSGKWKSYKVKIDHFHSGRSVPVLKCFWSPLYLFRHHLSKTRQIVNSMHDRRQTRFRFQTGRIQNLSYNVYPAVSVADVVSLNTVVARCICFFLFISMYTCFNRRNIWRKQKPFSFWR